MEQFTSAEGQAEVIVNRVRRTMTEHIGEDPVLYERFSKLIDETLKDYADKRIEQLELLRRVQAINDRVRERRTHEDVPELLRDRDVAKFYYDVVRDQAEKAGFRVKQAVAAYAAIAIDDVIRTKRKVDRANDLDVPKQIEIAIEDELFKLKEIHLLDFNYETIDHILARCIDIAKRRLP